ncbi:hypothetical protein BC835DRAFT_367571 [Cytidiella melzeri]|nr:hypothetical protein BC835DRAFT_367571 [Cytidiella melzeri]
MGSLACYTMLELGPVILALMLLSCIIYVLNNIHYSSSRELHTETCTLRLHLVGGGYKVAFSPTYIDMLGKSCCMCDNGSRETAETLLLQVSCIHQHNAQLHYVRLLLHAALTTFATPCILTFPTFQPQSARGP